MIVPWPLVGSLLVATVAGVLAVRPPARRGAVIDLALSIALPALLVGRVAVLLRDLLLGAPPPPPAAWLSITAGVSAPAAVLAGIWAGQRLLRRHAAEAHAPATGAEGRARAIAAVPAAAAIGLATWNVLALARGEAGGLAAPVPLGVPLSGGSQIPASLWEAAAWVAVWWLVRPEHAATASWSEGRRWGVFAAMAAGQALLGPSVRPGLATPDRDADVLLALTATAVALLALRGRRRGAWITAAVGSSVTVALLALTAAPTDTPPLIAVADAASGATADLLPDWDAAVTAGAGVPPARIPRLDADGLAAVLAAADGPVVVNLWASWCPPCHAEAPTIGRAARALAGRANVVGLLVEDDPANAQAFADAYDLPFPTVVDDGAAASLGYVGLPTTIVLRPDGTVADRAVGGVDGGALAAAVQEAMMGR